MTAAKKKKQKTICIQQVRSPIGTPPKHREVLRGLGLRRIRHVVEREDTPAIRGMIKKIPYLVRVIEDQNETA